MILSVKSLYKSFNIVGEIAVLLQGLAENSVVKDKNILVMEKAIQVFLIKYNVILFMSSQSLIERCAGNYDNQLVAVNGQVVDSINLILKHSVKVISYNCLSFYLYSVILH